MVYSGLPSIFPIRLPSGPPRGGGQQRGFLISSRSHFSSGGPSGWDGGLDDSALLLYPSVPPFHSYPGRFVLGDSFPCGGSRARTCSFLFIILVPLGSLATLPLILSQSRSLLRAASMAAARVLGPSFRTSPRSSLSLNASIYTSANRACIGPLFRIASSGKASAAKPAILSSTSSMASLSPCRSLNNFLTASMAVRSLAYCRTRADFSSVQVRAVKLPTSATQPVFSLFVCDIRTCYAHSNARSLLTSSYSTRDNRKGKLASHTIDTSTACNVEEIEHNNCSLADLRATCEPRAQKVTSFTALRFLVLSSSSSSSFFFFLLPSLSDR
ncbi:unnamed protein product [Acanthosepion pharaonis]|uniref:Uncharacterized protein n=1 Tax=Acanthosepion pharaonis TaxID=158019 RepID=A0A812CHI4_ACAPH|nr:unnamed protein product [Sepia pharaonis]